MQVLGFSPAKSDDGGIGSASPTAAMMPSARKVQQHRLPCRQRSLLSESLRSTDTCGLAAMSRAASCESMASGELSEAMSLEVSSDSGSPSSGAAADLLDASSGGVSIPYTRVARERIDRAEAQGRRRDEQLEMLHAVRQYMAANRGGSARSPQQQLQQQC